MILKQEKPQIKPQVSSNTAKTLGDLDLDSELLSQFQQAKDLLEAAKTDETVPLSQKAQVINTTLSIIKSIIDAQKELRNLENLKSIEVTLIETLQKYPELSENFLKDYEKALAARSTK